MTSRKFSWLGRRWAESGRWVAVVPVVVVEAGAVVGDSYLSLARLHRRHGPFEKKFPSSSPPVHHSATKSIPSHPPLELSAPPPASPLLPPSSAEAASACVLKRPPIRARVPVPDPPYVYYPSVLDKIHLQPFTPLILVPATVSSPPQSLRSTRDSSPGPLGLFSASSLSLPLRTLPVLPPPRTQFSPPSPTKPARCTAK